jgi:hypothetical protein
LTLRELSDMAEGRLQAEWTQTAEVLAMIYNMNRAPKTKVIQAWRLNPFGRPTKDPVAKMSDDEAWDTFRGLFDRGVFGGQRR